MLSEEKVRIPYEEYKAIGEVMRAHLQTHEGQLRAMIAFGDLVTQGNTYDIDLLEVIEGWQGMDFVAFSSTPELPLRGQLRLHLLTPEQFEHPTRAKHFSDKRRAADLLNRIREGYDVVYEDPPLYALDVLTQAEASSLGGNPLDFLVSGGMRQL